MLSILLVCSFRFGNAIRHPILDVDTGNMTQQSLGRCDATIPSEVSVAALHNSVTVLVTSSPRPQDASSKSLSTLVDVMENIQQNIGTFAAQIIVAFDGVAPNLGDSMRTNYEDKIKGFAHWVQQQPLGRIHIWRNPSWSHEANMLKRVFNDHLKKNPTPLVYRVQDDSKVIGDVDFPFIVRTVLCDPAVDYVKFFWAKDCTKETWRHLPVCSATVHSSGMLRQVPFYSCRPHFAKTSFYENEILPRIPDNARESTEQILGEHVPKTMWCYGVPGSQGQDKNTLWGSYNRGQSGWQGNAFAISEVDKVAANPLQAHNFVRVQSSSEKV